MDAFNQQVNMFFASPQFILIMIWTLFWKGLALWRAAGKRQLIWFLILFIINTVGLLEILYVLYLNRWDIDGGRLLAFLEKRFGRK